jgi:hypothetical protein
VPNASDDSPLTEDAREHDPRAARMRRSTILEVANLGATDADKNGRALRTHLLLT